MADEDQTAEQERVVDWASEYLGEGQDLLDGAGNHAQQLARADVYFQASAAMSLYEIQAALKIMLPMLEQIATPLERIQYQIVPNGGAGNEELKEAFEHASEQRESAHRSDEPRG